MTESLAGHKGRRFVQAVRREAATIGQWERIADNSSKDLEMNPGANQYLNKNTGFS
jgi:hypothetical protein